MSFLKILVVSLVLYTFTFAQTVQLHGVLMSDMDTSVEACNDFYNYANGKWRADNPIPASMPRWSRRWQAGEKSKDRLREILDEMKLKTDYAKGSSDQIVNDFYLTCTDEALADKNGMTPIVPMLARIDKAKTSAELQDIIADLAMSGIPAPFGLGGGQDNHDPANVIAQVYAAGLGLPDRDYYLKSEARFSEARDKYKAHVAKMFTLAGYNEQKAAAASASIFALETELAKASLDNVALRDPAATDHKMKFDELTKLTPNFNWTAYYKHLGVKPADLNVSEPEFLR